MTTFFYHHNVLSPNGDLSGDLNLSWFNGDGDNNDLKTFSHSNDSIGTRFGDVANVGNGNGIFGEQICDKVWYLFKFVVKNCTIYSNGQTSCKMITWWMEGW